MILHIQIYFLQIGGADGESGGVNGGAFGESGAVSGGAVGKNGVVSCAWVVLQMML